MAPEVVKGGGKGHGIAVDWWSLGVLLYELLTGASPFTVEGEKNSQSEISKRILNNNPPLPKSISAEAQDILRRLFEKDPRRRLGSGLGGSQEIKTHRFFQGIDWNSLKQKKVKPPFKPVIKGELDVSNFSEEFTQMMPIDSPAAIPSHSGRIFRGYSFVAPSVIFGKNAIADSIFSPPEQATRPDEVGITYARLFADSSFYSVYNLSDEILGQGTFSICKKCKHKESGKDYAVKILSRRIDTSQEVQILNLCQGHPNIVALKDVHHDELHTYVVLELLSGGELLDRIRNKKSFTELEAKEIVKKLVSAVKFMNTRGVVHRDLKPENILFVNDSPDAEMKLVDFGFARLRGSQPLQTPCFTLTYAAPEVLKHATRERMEGYDEACDIWSLGVILFTMLSGKSPFPVDTEMASSAFRIVRNIQEGNINLNTEEWENVSDSAKNLIQGLLKVDPKTRLTLDEISGHDWLCGRVSVPTTPLMTPDVLGSSGPQVGNALRVALQVYHKAARAGFRLMDVENAPLAKRRKMKNISHENSKVHPKEEKDFVSTPESDKDRSPDSGVGSLRRCRSDSSETAPLPHVLYTTDSDKRSPSHHELKPSYLTGGSIESLSDDPYEIKSSPSEDLYVSLSFTGGTTMTSTVCSHSLLQPRPVMSHGENVTYDLLRDRHCQGSSITGIRVPVIASTSVQPATHCSSRLKGFERIVDEFPSTANYVDGRESPSYSTDFSTNDARLCNDDELSLYHTPVPHTTCSISNRNTDQIDFENSLRVYNSSNPEYVNLMRTNEMQVGDSINNNNNDTSTTNKNKFFSQRGKKRPYQV